VTSAGWWRGLRLPARGSTPLAEKALRVDVGVLASVVCRLSWTKIAFDAQEQQRRSWRHRPKNMVPTTTPHVIANTKAPRNPNQPPRTKQRDQRQQGRARWSSRSAQGFVTAKVHDLAQVAFLCTCAGFPRSVKDQNCIVETKYPMMVRIAAITGRSKPDLQDRKHAEMVQHNIVEQCRPQRRRENAIEPQPDVDQDRAKRRGNRQKRRLDSTRPITLGPRIQTEVKMILGATVWQRLLDVLDASPGMRQSFAFLALDAYHGDVFVLSLAGRIPPEMDHRQARGGAKRLAVAGCLRRRHFAWKVVPPRKSDAIVQAHGETNNGQGQQAPPPQDAPKGQFGMFEIKSIFVRRGSVPQRMT